MKIKTNQDRMRCLKGGALVGTISATVLLGIMGASVIELTSTSQTTHLSANASSRAFYIAESGLSHAQNAAKTDGWLHGREKTLNFKSGEQVTVLRKGDYFWATSVVDEGTATEGRAKVPMLVDTSDDDGSNPPPGPPVSERPDGFVILGDHQVYCPTSSILEGNVGVIGEDVELRGLTDGNVYGRNVYITRTTLEVETNVSGDMYSSGCVYVQHADVEGDIHAAGNILVYGSYADLGGWIFADGQVLVSSSATVLGNIHAEGEICIEHGAVVGSPDNPVEIRTNGDIYLNESATVYGTIYAGGTISVSSSSTVHGDTYANSTVSGESRITGSSNPESPTYLKEPIAANLSILDEIKLPDADHFTSGGIDLVTPSIYGGTARYSISPRSYGQVVAKANTKYTRYASLQLNAGAKGDSYYYFNRLTFEEHTKLYLNLSGEHDIRIFVSYWLSFGNCVETYVSLDGVNYLPITHPSVEKEVASRVYWETHCGCSIGCYASFCGTVHSPFGHLSVGNYSYLYGAYYSGGGHSIGCSYFKQEMPNYFTEQETSSVD